MIGSIRPHGAAAVLLIVCLATGAVATSVLGEPPDRPGPPNSVSGNSGPPNILFIIMDDVGIDQLKIFNPDAPIPPETRMIDEIAANGVSFRNFWTMPECSPSRACFFTGRYPFRTGVDAAILDADLPGAQVSPLRLQSRGS